MRKQPARHDIIGLLCVLALVGVIVYARHPAGALYLNT